MNNNRNEFLNELLKSTNEYVSDQFSRCSLADMDVFEKDFNVKFTPIRGLVIFEKGAINLRDLELYSEEEVEKVLGDLDRLKSFVERIAGGKCSHSDEAVSVLKSLHNETI